jgi:WD40 repeat protein
MSERDVFTAALHIQDPAERAAYLDRACAADPALRQRVGALLEAHGQAGDFLGRPAAEQLAGGERTQAELEVQGEEEQSLDFLSPPRRPDSLGRLGHYEVLEVVGRGGMGVVLRAFDEVLHRVVAIKVLAAPLAAGASARKRFLREARAAAAVSHDNVVTIHAVEEGAGVPHLVMQYVAGMSLQDKLDREGPPELREVLRIGLQAAAGLAAAHAHGIVHRDVKPANVLLENGVERVKLTDFGLARAADDASLTQSGVIAGTPLYMSPEQAEGRAVDHRSDLFSLGSVLYALCTGRPPFRADTATAVLRRVCESTPRPIREVNPDVPTWLCDVISKLHAKDPSERFQSAAEVAALLGEHLARLQRPDTSPERRKEEGGRRNQQPAAFHSSVFFHPSSFLLHPFKVLLLLLAGLGLTEATGITRITARVIHILTTDALHREPLESSAEQAGEVRRFEGHTNWVISVALSPDGRRALSASHDRTVRLWNVETGEELRRMATGGGWVEAVAFSPDGRRAVSGHEDGVVRMWEVETGQELKRFGGQKAGVRSVAFSPDGRHVLSGGKDATVRLWDAESGEELRRFEGHTDLVESVAFSRDGRRALSGSWDRTVRLWDVSTAEEIRRFVGSTSGVEGVAFSPNGEWALSGGGDGTVRLWNMATGREVRRFEGHTEAVNAVAFSPDGLRVLSAGQDGTVRLWDVESGRELQTFRGHRDWVHGVACSADGRYVLSGGGGGKVDGKVVRGDDFSLRLWRLPDPEVRSATASGPFVILNGDGKAGRTYATLAAAVAGAADGSTIEVRGNGPFDSGTIWIDGKALTIRAASGCHPVLRLAREGAGNFDFLRTNSPLVLEGLELRRISSKSWDDCREDRIVWCENAPFSAANCRFFIKPGLVCVVGQYAPAGRLVNCELLGARASGFDWKCPKQGSLVVENCSLLTATGVGLHARDYCRDITVRLTRNTWSGLDPVQFMLDSAGNQADRIYRLEASENVFQGRLGAFHFVQTRDYLARAKALDVAQAEDLLARLVGWSGRRNVYSPGDLLALSLNWKTPLPTARGKDLPDWQKFWKGAEKDSLQGPVRFQEVNIPSRLERDPLQLTPADLRLQPDSVGKKEAEGGKDPGADVDLIGPGPAYERWKKTPGYQDWLKATRQAGK